MTEGSHFQTIKTMNPGSSPGKVLCLVVWVLVLGLVPQSSWAWGLYDTQLGLGRAATQLNQGKYLESLAGYHEVATFAANPEDRAQALFFMGTVYGLYLNQKEGALRYFDRVLVSYPRTITAGESLFNKGMVLFEKGEYELARETFLRYGQEYPGGGQVLAARAWEKSAENRLVEGRKEPVQPTRFTGDTTLRILIRAGTHSLKVVGDPGFQCTDPVSGQVLFSGDLGVFSIKKGHLWVSGKDLGTDRCELLSNGQTMTVGKAKYRGLLILQVASNGMEVINRLGVETYLYGVVPKEMAPDWPLEALKAQAVAARSYALFLKEKRRDKPFDLMATTASQVYGGYDAKYRKAIGAVDATRGQVMTHGGKVAIAYYHANSGGHTEDAGNVWVADMPYLKGITDPYSKKVPGNKWQCSLRAQDIEQALAVSGMHVGKVTGLRPLGTSASGRVRTVRIISDSGAFSIKSNNFRLKLDPIKVKSTRFAIAQNGDEFQLSGTGFGHGVGMSQWGARNMALAEESYERILAHYYQGASLKTLDYALRACDTMQ